ncbi:hypothetical protein V6N13_054829 [Hibiscus sabdariffa]
MATDYCSTKTVKDRLHAWGLGDTYVKSLGGKKFVLKIKDEELLALLEKQKWSLLEEVFTNIEYWSEFFQVEERTTWVEVRGVPLHCWNDETFKRIAGLWGTLTALGENANQRIDCEKITLLISTKQVHRIEQVVNLEVGNFSYNVWVSEALPTKVQHIVQNKVQPSVQREKEVESSSSSSSSPSPLWRSSNQRRKSNSQSNRGDNTLKDTLKKV